MGLSLLRRARPLTTRQQFSRVPLKLDRVLQGRASEGDIRPTFRTNPPIRLVTARFCPGIFSTRPRFVETMENRRCLPRMRSDVRPIFQEISRIHVYISRFRDTYYWRLDTPSDGRLPWE